MDHDGSSMSLSVRLESIKLEYCSLAFTRCRKPVLFRSTGLPDPSKEDMHISPQDEQAIGHHPNQNNSQGEEHGYKIKDAGLKDKWRLFHRSHAQYRRFARNMCMYTYIYMYKWYVCKYFPIYIYIYCICLQVSVSLLLLIIVRNEIVPSTCWHPLSRFCCPTGVLQCPAWDRNQTIRQ